MFSRRTVFIVYIAAGLDKHIPSMIVQLESYTLHLLWLIIMHYYISNQQYALIY